mmetsp:Transcript_29747/g.88982  ORF Transcript_29747/g.88982 Transcript_29747/m.88982 type:complete len:226 (+) Transcript_29747:211-888(+)
MPHRDRPRRTPPRKRRAPPPADHLVGLRGRPTPARRPAQRAAHELALRGAAGALRVRAGWAAAERVRRGRAAHGRQLADVPVSALAAIFEQAPLRDGRGPPPVRLGRRPAGRGPEPDQSRVPRVARGPVPRESYGRGVRVGARSRAVPHASKQPGVRGTAPLPVALRRSKPLEPPGRRLEPLHQDARDARDARRAGRRGPVLRGPRHDRALAVGRERPSRARGPP